MSNKSNVSNIMNEILKWCGWLIIALQEAIKIISQ